MAERKLSSSKVILVGMVIILLPSIMMLTIDRYERSSFRELMTINREDCVRTAGDDDRLKNICRQSGLQADNAYSSSQNTLWVTRSMLLAIICVLAVSVVSLKNQINGLEERLNV